ncbi:MAG: hypothetical protein QXT53_02915 [Ignisphaera sp.]
MKHEIIDHELIGVMASTAYEAPSIVNFSEIPFVNSFVVRKAIDMYMDEAIKFVYDDIKLKPISYEVLAEDAYALCNNGLLMYIGRFAEGMIPSNKLYRQFKDVCRGRIFLHTHPVPIPIPSPEDIVSAHQIGYEVECVISKISSDRAILTCLKPLNGWNNVLEDYKEVEKMILSISRFVVAGDRNTITFLPFPTVEEVEELIKYYRKQLSNSAISIHVNIDLANKVYSIE